MECKLISLTIDISGITQVIEAHRQGVRAGLQRTGEVVAQEANRQIEKIYSGSTSAIPTRAQVAAYNVNFKSVAKKNFGKADSGVTGKGNAPAWERKDTLRNNSKVVAMSDTEVVIDNDCDHAAARHALGVERVPVHPAMGVLRINRFHEDAARIAGPQLAEAFGDGYRKGAGL